MTPNGATATPTKRREVIILNSDISLERAMMSPKLRRAS